MSDDNEEGMTMEEFLRHVVEHVIEDHPPAEDDSSPEARAGLDRAQAAIQEAIKTEYLALCERAMVVDALRNQPDLTLETAGRGWALHYLASHTASVLSKHTRPIEAQEYVAQKLEHEAALQRWATRLASTVLTAEHLDAVLKSLNQQG